MGEVDAEHSSPTQEFTPGAQTDEEEQETLQYGDEVPDWYVWSRSE